LDRLQLYISGMNEHITEAHDELRKELPADA